jgi:uncharacterized phage-associated protein
MEPAKAKIVEAILFLISEADRKEYEITQYDIVKALFLADKTHLNRFGRPITFDNYMAMANGPVPSFAYDVLKAEASPSRLGITDLQGWPWDRIADAHANSKAFIYRGAKREPSSELLCESDLEALSDALTTVRSLTFGQIRKLTHDDPAYIAAWGEGEAPNAPISYGMLFEVPDFEKAEQLQFVSQHQ